MPRANCYRRCAIAPALILLLAVAGNAPAQAQTWHGTIETDGAVQKVHNPDNPLQPPETVALTELWRLDGESDETPLGVVRAATADASGTVYLLDTQLKRVVVVAANGEVKGHIGREGDGPSEFRRPIGLLIDNAGNIGVVQNPPAKIALLKPDGESAGDRFLPDYGRGRRLVLRAAKMAAGRLYVTLARWSYDETGNTSYLNAVASLGDGDDQYVIHLEQRSRRTADNNLYTERERSRGMPWEWSVGPTGRVFTSPDFDAYEILVHDRDGDLVNIIDRPYEPWQREPAHVAELQALFDQSFAGRTRRGQPMTYEVSRTEQAIEELLARRDGTLWVLPSRGAYDQPPAALGTFDVFDENGRFTRQVTLLGEGGLDTDYFLFTRDLLIVVRNVRLDLGRNSENDDVAERPYEVICYQVP